MEFSISIKDLQTGNDEIDDRIYSNDVREAVMKEAMVRHRTDHDFSKGSIQLTPIDNPLKTIDPTYNERRGSEPVFGFGCNCGELLLARMFGKKLEANGRAFKDDYESPVEVQEYTGSSIAVTPSYTSTRGSYGI